MPSPSESLATLRPELTGSFEEFSLSMNMAGFVGLQALAPIEVAKASGIFGVVPVQELLKDRNLLRAPGGGYSRGDWDFENHSFTCLEYGAEEPVDDNEATMYADFFDAEQVSAMRAQHDVMYAMEKRIADAVFNSTTWTGAALTTNVGTEWSTVATADPVADVTAAKKKVFEGSGLKANALIFNWTVFLNLQQNTDIIDRIKYSGLDDPKTSGITINALASVFDVNYVLVAGGAKNTAKEGQAASLAHIWSNEYCMVAKIATGPDVREPCIGRTFHYAEDGSTVRGTMESYRAEEKRSDMIRCRHQVDEVIIYPAAGHLLGNITA